MPVGGEVDAFFFSPPRSFAGETVGTAGLLSPFTSFIEKI